MSEPVQRRIPSITGLAASAAGPLFSFALISMVSNLLMLVGSIFMLQVYDRVLPSRSIPTLVALLLIVALLYAAYAAIETLRSRMTARFATVFDERVSPLAFEAGVRGRLGNSMGQGDPVRDLDTVRTFLGGAAPSVFFDLPWLPIYLGAIFLLHPLLGWITVGGALTIAGILVATEILARRPAKLLASAAAQRQMQSDDARNAVESVIGMGLMASVVRRWRSASDAQNLASMSSTDRNSLLSSLSKAFRLLLQSAVLATGAYLVIRNEMSGGGMIAASILSSRALAPIEQAVAQWRSFVAARQAWQRLRKMLTAAAAGLREVALPIPKHTLQVRHLMVGTTRQAPLLTGITFELVAGEALAVLGPSGSGKSSLLRTLIGAWSPLSGEIRLDGSELGHFEEARRGQFFGYLGQQVDLLAGTVAENVSRFAPSPDSQILFAAAETAGVHALIASLPNGYDTPIGAGGLVLSAGQKQRIGLARALYGSPFLVLLDEPNSNLDAEGDAALNEAIVAAKRRGAIVVIVAHRPSALANIDKVLFLRSGRQQAFGPKEEVLQSILQQSPQAAKPRAAVAVGHG